MISIEQFKYKGEITSAYNIGVRSSDPHFAADLANKLVFLFFDELETEKIQLYQETLSFLSTTLGEARIKVDERRAALELFLIENATLVGNVARSSSDELEDIDVNRVVRKAISDLAQLRDERKAIELGMEKLDEVKKSFLENGVIDSDFFTRELRFSANFRTKIELLSSRSSSNEILDILESEQKRLEKTLQKLSGILPKEEKEAEALLKLSEKLGSLKLDYMVNKTYFESLKNTLQEKILEAGADSLTKDRLHSKAVAPLFASSPNSRLIGVLSIISFFILALFYVIIRQKYKEIIYSEGQLKGLIPGATIMSISSKKISKNKLNVTGSGAENFSWEGNHIFGELAQKGSIGSIVELGASKSKKKDNSDGFSLFFANVLQLVDKKSLIIRDKNPSNIMIPGSTEQVNLAKEVDLLELDLSACEESIKVIKQSSNENKTTLISLKASLDISLKLRYLENSNFCVFLVKVGHSAVPDLEFVHHLIKNIPELSFEIVLVK